MASSINFNLGVSIQYIEIPLYMRLGFKFTCQPCITMGCTYYSINPIKIKVSA